DGGTAPTGRTILLTAEDALSFTVRPRLDALCADPSMIMALRMKQNGNHVQFDLSADLLELEATIKETGAKLVIIDPIGAYLPSKIDSHNDAALRNVLGPVAALAERMNVAILMVMHLTKDSQRKLLYRTQGSIAFIGAARISLAVAADPKAPPESPRVLVV